jgi:hypothetical protein
LLEELKLRLVDNSKFKSEADVDIKGFRKVYEIESYAGVFKDSDNKSYDLRPLESCPSLNNFSRMEKRALQRLLMKAFENQLEAI